MSREIKFRVWDKKYECYVKVESIDFDFHGNMDSVWVDCEEHHHDHSVLNIDEVILEQYTGAKDKNGKKIYEGDIVKVYYRNIRWKLCGEYGVFWDDLNAHYVLSKTEDTDEADFVLGGFNYKYEVIGNIRENHELLGGDE